MPHIGSGELLVIIAVILLLFGARKLPELGRGLAQGLKEFRKASRDEVGEDKKPADAESAEDGKPYSES